MNPLRLLAVDDDPDICEIIRQVAEQLGFDVTVAYDADGFRSAYDAFNPTHVTLDLRLPGTDGIELLRFLDAKNSRAAIMLISGVDHRTLSAARRLCVTHGLDLAGTLEKPLAVGDLRNLLGSATVSGDELSEVIVARAIQQRELFVEYQPKMRLNGGSPWEVEGVEALVRWQHPTRGALPPADFLGAVEAFGLMGPLTDVVLESTLSACRMWNGSGHDLSVAVNLHPSLLADLEFPDRLGELLRAAEIPPERIVIEVTESGAMADPAATMEILTRLRLKGVRVSMDDFGTGYSSLLQLHRMPFSELKIDRSFVDGVETDAEAAVIVHAIIDLGGALGMQVCAEGVETEAALNLVRKAGCSSAQGYYFSRPIAVDRIPAFLEHAIEMHGGSAS